MLAIVGGRPRVLSLVELIDHFVDFRREVVRRRTEFELRKAEARAHILEGLKIALDHLDAVIALIRASQNPAEAREGLMATFGLSVSPGAGHPRHAAAAPDRPRAPEDRRRAGRAAQDDRAAARHPRQRPPADGDRRPRNCARSASATATSAARDIIDESGEFRIEDLIADEDMAITVTHTGYIKRTAISSYRNQRRGGKGRIGMRIAGGRLRRPPLRRLDARLHLMIFSDRGRAYWLKVHEIPDVGPDGKGKAIANLVSMEAGEKIAALLAVKAWEDDKFVVMGTRKGVVKKTRLSAFRTRAPAASSPWASKTTTR